MTWVKLSDTFAIDPRWDALSVEAFAAHVAALCDCAQKLTDGRLTVKAVRRLPIVDDPLAAAEELVEAGLWSRTSAGFMIVGYLEDQLSAADVEERAEQKRRYDQEFQRDRRRATPKGETVAQYREREAEAAGMSVGQWLASQRTGVVRPSYDVGVSRPVPTRPDPEGRGGSAKGARASPSAHGRRGGGDARPRLNDLCACGARVVSGTPGAKAGKCGDCYAYERFTGRS